MYLMMDFFWPNSRALLPTFRKNCPDGVSFCPDWVSFCPDFHPQPLFFTPPSHTPFGDMYVYKPHPPTPPQNTPFQKPPRPAPPRPAPPAPAPARRRRARRWKMRSEWSASTGTCRAPQRELDENTGYGIKFRISELPQAPGRRPASAELVKKSLEQ